MTQTASLLYSHVLNPFLQSFILTICFLDIIDVKLDHDNVSCWEHLAVVLIILQAVMKELNNENMAEADRLRLVMLYALRFEKENPPQMEVLINKLEAKSSKYKPGVGISCAFPVNLNVNFQIII